MVAVQVLSTEDTGIKLLSIEDSCKMLFTEDS